MANYDTIYFGFPVWWYDLPMPMWTFLESYNFKGKTIINKAYYTNKSISIRLPSGDVT